MNAQRIKLNIVPGGVAPIVHVSQYDVGRVLEFALYDGVGIAEIESGTSIDIRGTKPDKTGFSYPCTYSGNVVSIATREQMTAVSGSFDCELHLVKDTQDIGTANFILEVEPAALHEDTVISESELPAIVEAARNTGLTTEAVQELVASARASAASATAAANSATAAASSETNAADSASAAASSATNAAASSGAAETSKIDAERAASSASASAASASQSATRAQEYAAQALENATGTKEFSGSDPGLVPRSTGNGEYLNSNGEWTPIDFVIATNLKTGVSTYTEFSAPGTAIAKDTYLYLKINTSGEKYLCKATKAIAENEKLVPEGAPMSGVNLKVVKLIDEIDAMKTSFQDGVDAIYGAITAKNVIPSASTPSALADAVGAVYDRGRSLGDSEGYARGLEDGQHIVKLGSGTSYNVSSYKGYKNFTKDNFIVKINSIAVSDKMGQSSHNSGTGMRAPGTSSMSVIPSVTYNASTGAVAIGNLSGTCNNGFEPTSTVTASSTVTVTASVDVYLVY